MPTSLSSFQIRTRLPNTVDLNTYRNKKNSDKDGNNSAKPENDTIDLAKIKTPYLIDALKSVKRGEALPNVDSYGIYCLLLTVEEEVIDWCKKICGEYDETNLTNMEKFNRIVNEYNIFSNELKLFEKQFSSYSFSKDCSLDYSKLAIKCSQISMLHSIIMNFTKFLLKKKVLPNDFLNEFYYDIRTKCIELTNEVLGEIMDNENLVELFDKEPFCFFSTHTCAKSSIQLLLSSAQPFVKPINADILLQTIDKLFSLFKTLEKSSYSIMTSFLDHYKTKLDSFGEDPYDTGYFREFIGNY
ncbi:unnamed protein product [[Candida] boidinii]|nr:unnamed protein product [[Candida] boidinii]